MAATVRWPRLVAALAVSLLLAGCQTTGMTDSAGGPIQISQEQPIAPGETTSNVAAFFDPAFVRAVKRVVRDNEFPYETLEVENRGGKGIIRIGHSGGSSRWGDGDAYWREESFRERAKEFVTDLGDVREIRRRNAVAGYRGVGHHVRSIARCVIAFTAYDLIGTTGDFRGTPFDTGVLVLFCGQDPDPATFDAMLSELDLVRDRGTYRAAIQARAPAGGPESRLPLANAQPLISRHRLAMRWHGFDGEIEGMAQALDSGTGGELLVALPAGEGTCKGTFLYGPGRITGTWSAACSNGLAASGSFKMVGKDKSQGHVGVGLDSAGRPVTFTIGPPIEKPRPSTAL